MSTKIKITESQLKRIIAAKNIQENQIGMGFATEPKEEKEESGESSTHESVEKIADLFCDLFPKKCKDADYIEGIFSLAKSSILSGDKNDAEEDEEEEGEEEENEPMGNTMIGGDSESEEEEEEEGNEEEEEDEKTINESIQKIKSNFKRFL
jgi:hypothetical protein